MTSAVPLDEALRYLGIPNDQNGGIQELLDRTEEAVAGYCNRKFQPTAMTERFDGGDEILSLELIPVESITSVTDRSSGDVLVEGTDFSLDARRGWLRQLGSSGLESGAAWPAHPQRWEVAYEGGYAVIPAAVKQAILQELAQRVLQPAAGETEQEFGDEKHTFEEGLSEATRTILGPYVLPVI